MAPILPNTVSRLEVVATAAANLPYILPPEGVADICYTAKVPVAGVANAVEATVSPLVDVQAGTAEWGVILANVTATSLGLPSALADATGAPLTVTAIRANRGDQDLTLVLTGRVS